MSKHSAKVNIPIRCYTQNYSKENAAARARRGEMPGSVVGHTVVRARVRDELAGIYKWSWLVTWSVTEGRGEHEHPHSILG